MKPFGKKGASRVTSEMMMKIGGEIVLPVLAFLVVLYIVISVGASRGSQTYFQSVDYANIIDSLVSFNGLASLRYVPIMNDFTMQIQNSVLSMNTQDGKAPNQRIIHIPQSLVFTSKYIATGPNQKAGFTNQLGQVRFTRTQNGLQVDSFQANEIGISLGTPNRPKVYDCGAPLKLAKQPLYVGVANNIDDPGTISQSDSSANIFDLQNQVVKKNIATTTTQASAGLMVGLITRQGTVNSLVIFSDGSTSADAFACALANSLTTIDSTGTKSSATNANGQSSNQNIDSVVLVPSQNSPFTATQWGDPASTPKVLLELSYQQTSQNSGAQNAGAQYNPILAKAISDAYAQVYS